MARSILLPLALCALASPILANSAAEKLIKRGDKYYGNRGKGNKWVEKAVECYEKALAVDTKSVAASWKIARSCHWLGTETEGSKEKMKIFQKGIDAAKRALTIDEKSIESHYWLGVCYGKFGTAKGIMNSLGLVPHIKKEMNRVLELDKSFAGGGAYVVLGRMYYKLPGLAGGSKEKSLEFLNKALEINKDSLIAHLFRAETFLALEKESKAVEDLKWVVSAPDEKERAPENVGERKQAKELLAKITKDNKEEAK